MNLKNLFFIALIGLSFTACKEDEEPVSTTDTLELNLTGLEDLGSDYTYEGWIIVDGAPVTTGTFDVNADGTLSKTSFELESADLEAASTFVLTIEPQPDNDPAPSAVHILAGDFSGTSASLTVGHGSALGNDFTASTGNYILATPTDGMDNNEASGVWWLDNSGAAMAAGLDLPTLPDGWKYEGWAVIDGTPVSTGTFTDLAAADDAAVYSGTMGGPPFPGEDFIMNALTGLTFPTDLTGATVVISIEPSPDNSAAPFLLKPLVGLVAADAAVHTVQSMDNNADATNPSGSVSR